MHLKTKSVPRKKTMEVHEKTQGHTILQDRRQCEDRGGEMSNVSTSNEHQGFVLELGDRHRTDSA